MQKLLDAFSSSITKDTTTTIFRNISNDIDIYIESIFLYLFPFCEDIEELRTDMQIFTKWLTHPFKHNPAGT